MRSSHVHQYWQVVFVITSFSGLAWSWFSKNVWCIVYFEKCHFLKTFLFLPRLNYEICGSQKSLGWVQLSHAGNLVMLQVLIYQLEIFYYVRMPIFFVGWILQIIWDSIPINTEQFANAQSNLKLRIDLRLNSQNSLILIQIFLISLSVHLSQWFIKGWNPFMGMPCLSVARSLCLPPISLWRFNTFEICFRHSS
jgi:hypothetical protein